MYFYPTLNDEIKDSSGYSVSSYSFSYAVDGIEQTLLPKGKGTLKFDDENWKIERDGMRIRKTISFEYPEMLYGKNGIACSGAELGICITWVNRSLTQMGNILPINEYSDGVKKIYVFDHDFKPGEIQGDLELDLLIYIKEATENVLSGEEFLINDEGVSVGILEETYIDFGSLYMDFPIQEVNSKKQPLWWIEIAPWTNPTTELFNADNLCIYLNTAYDACPRVGDTIKNVDVLIEIIATAYTMLFTKIEELNFLQQTLNDVDLEPGSISKIMFYFYDSCDYPIDMSSIERKHKSIWMNVASMIYGGDNNDSQ